jgi:hypothetical protein
VTSQRSSEWDSRRCSYAGVRLRQPARIGDAPAQRGARLTSGLCWRLGPTQQRHRGRELEWVGYNSRIGSGLLAGPAHEGEKEFLFTRSIFHTTQK